jgi:hypothetical protein
MSRRTAILLALFACGGDKEPGDSGSTTTTETPSPFELIAQGVDGGTLLSAWHDGTEVLMVGGDLQGGAGEIARYADGALCVEAEPADRALWWIHGERTGEWWAVGTEGLILHSADGTRNREDVDTTMTLFGVWDDGTNVWAVGADRDDLSRGEIWRRSDGTWSLFKSAEDLEGGIFKVWNHWFVGEGVAYRLEEGELVAHHPPGGEKLLTVRGPSSDDVWAVGGVASPAMLHWTGSSWETIEVERRCVNQGLNGVWTSDSSEVWVAGMTGGLGKWDGTTWTCPDLPITTDDFHAVYSVDGSEILWVGGNFIAGIGAPHYATIGRHGEPLLGTIEATPCP